MTEKRQEVRKSTAKARAVAPLGLDAGAPRPAATGRRSNIVPARREDASGDSVLSRYFREMSTHQVMGAEEELEAAERVESTEVEM